MIIINKGQTNNIALNLQAVTYSSPKYLFNLINDITNVAVNFIGTDSSSTTAYNKFSIEETTSTDFYNSKVNLNPSGFWTYNIYAQTSSTNLEPSLALNFLETGKVSVVSTYSIDNIYQYEVLPVYQPDYIKLNDLTAYQTKDTATTSTTSLTISNEYDIYIFDTNSGDLVVTLPATADEHQKYFIKNIGSNTLTINATVDGANDRILNTNDSLTIIFSSGWYII